MKGLGQALPGGKTNKGPRRRNQAEDRGKVAAKGRSGRERDVTGLWELCWARG